MNIIKIYSLFKSHSGRVLCVYIKDLKKQIELRFTKEIVAIY